MGANMIFVADKKSTHLDPKYDKNLPEYDLNRLIARSSYEYGKKCVPTLLHRKYISIKVY